VNRKHIDWRRAAERRQTDADAAAEEMVDIRRDRLGDELDHFCARIQTAISRSLWLVDIVPRIIERGAQ
jgi:hypothetical protein